MILYHFLTFSYILSLLLLLWWIIWYWIVHQKQRIWFIEF